MRYLGAGSQGRFGCGLLSPWRRLSRNEGIYHVGHHELLHARVDRREVTGLVHCLAHAPVVTAPEFRVDDLFEEGRFAVNGRHDAPEVARLYRVLRHLEGHARYLGVPLREFAAATYYTDAYELFDEAYLRFEGISELLAGVGPVFEDAREVARGVARGQGSAALYALFDHLEREILLVLERQDVPQKLDVLAREQPVPAARAGQVDQTPPLEVADLADREGRELWPQALDYLADGEAVLGCAVAFFCGFIALCVALVSLLVDAAAVLHPVDSHPLDCSACSSRRTRT